MKWLTRDGVAAALAVGVAVGWGLSWQGLALLFGLFVPASLLTGLTHGPGRTIARNARQVLANGGAAAVAALLGSWPAAAGALAAATADTWATEIGAFSPWPPRGITTWARVPRGSSGGITALGTAGGIAGAAWMAALATLVRDPRRAAPGFAALVAAGIAGMIVDSVLGATCQSLFECAACGARFEQRGAVCHEPVRLTRGWRWLDNDVVNLAATLVGAASALVGKL